MFYVCLYDRDYIAINLVQLCKSEDVSTLGVAQ